MPADDHQAARVEFGRRVRQRRQGLGMRQVDLGGVPADDHQAARVEFGRRVRQRRQDLGMRQVDLAAAIGRSQAYLSFIETGRSDVRLSTLLRLRDALDTDVATLAAGL